MGNAPDTYLIKLQDDAADLSFQPSTLKLTVPENQTSAARFQAQARRRRWLGKKQSHSFNAKITASNGENQSLNGEAISSAILPSWLPAMLMALLGILCVAAGLIFMLIKQQQDQAKSLAQQQTQTVQVLTQTGQANLNLQQQQTIQASTLQASTATALAQTAQAQGDNDGDGISNSQELTLGTDPDSADTDGDGLTDGEEVNQYKTDPKNADMDGDGFDRWRGS